MAGRMREQYKNWASLADSRDIGLFTSGMWELLRRMVGITRSEMPLDLMPRRKGNQVLSSGRTLAPYGRGSERTCQFGRKKARRRGRCTSLRIATERERPEMVPVVESVSR